jgi:hypothetical protein
VGADDRTTRRDVGPWSESEVSGCPFARLLSGILAHEFSHVDLHTRIGLMRFLAGAIPAWFDESLAVIVSDDARYLKPGTTAQ